MSPHQQSLIAEHLELCAKIEKLRASLDAAFEAPLSVSVDEEMRMRDQLRYMRCYATVLFERIDAFCDGRLSKQLEARR
jgi:hypothetical protein